MPWASARRTRSSGCGRARSSCSRTCASTPKRRANDPAFASTLASYADVYVNDAFGTAHRAHASTVGIAKLLPAYAGLLMERELTMLSQLLEIARAPVRRDPRRREGQRQDRGHRQPAHEGRPARPRRRDGQHLPARAGQGDRQEPRRARSSGGRAADPRDRGEERRPGRVAGGRDRGQGGHARHRVQDAARREDPGELAHRRPRQAEPGPHASTRWQT